MQTSQPQQRKYNIEDDLKKFGQSYRTICEVHRQIYEELANLDIDITNKELLLALVAECYDYAKRMAKRLEFYYKQANPGLEKKWHAGFFKNQK